MEPTFSKNNLNYYKCGHCNGTGTCSSGENGSSCIVCAKYNELNFWNRKNHFGLICGSCGGSGITEPTSQKLNKRITPMLAVCLVFSLLVLLAVSILLNSSHFSEILTFSSAIIGSIVGYYFSNESKSI